MQSSEQQPKLGFWQVLKSILAAALGVQSEANRELDFTQGKPLYYIVGGLIFTLIFIVSLLAVVQLVSSSQEVDRPHPAQQYQHSNVPKHAPKLVE
jgi:uncharacterized membrane protein